MAGSRQDTRSRDRMPDVLQSPGNARTTIERWKSALLDLTAANPLVHLPDNGLVELSAPNDIFDPLVRRRKTLTFWDIGFKGMDRTVLRDAGNYPVRAAALETFRRLYGEATSLLQGQDINVLFVAFGMLKWQDPETGEEIRSPLLLVPVTLERNAAGSAFLIARMEEDVEVNPVLRLRLARPDINLQLPPSPEEAYLIPTAYFRSVSAAIAEREGWEVEESCRLGRFPLLKLRLFEDLAAQEALAQTHPLVGALAGEAEALERLPSIAVPTLDRLEEDEAEHDEGRFHLLDADPAQERAILAALRGQSFVLQGPPGTGKTQTITNIISECIAANKTVLLVSGRMASLEAVYQRLSERSLGDLCLLAHSLRTSKRSILAQLEHSLNGGAKGAKGGKGGKDMEELDELRSQLNLVARELHRVRAPLGISVYQANGVIADSALSARGLSLIFDVPEPASVTSERYREMELLVTQLSESPPLEEAAQNIWQGAFAQPNRPDLATAVQRTLQECQSRLQELKNAAAPVAHHCGDLPAPEGLSDMEWLVQVAEATADAPPVPRAWLTDLSDEEMLRLEEQVFGLRERDDRFRSDYAALTATYDPALLSLPHQDLQEQLLTTHEAILKPTFGENWADHVITHYADLADALESVGRDARAAHEQLEVIAQQIDVPLDETPEGRARILRIAKRAAGIEKGVAIWFQPGAGPQLLKQLYEAQLKWTQYLEREHLLFESYTPEMMNLDHSALKEALGGPQNGLTRLLSPSVIRATNALKAVIKPGVNAKERDFLADLDQALHAKELKRWCVDSEAQMKSNFGSHFLWSSTDWAHLRELLKEAEALCAEFPEGRLPEPLLLLITGENEQTKALDEQQSSVSALFADLRIHWEKLTNVTPPETLPGPTEGFVAVAEWCEQRLTATQALHDAFRSITDLRLPPQEEGQEPASVPIAAVTADLLAAQQLRVEQEAIDTERIRLSRDAGIYLGEEETDWTATTKALEAAKRLRQLFEGKPEPPLALLVSLEAGQDRPELKEALGKLRGAWSESAPVLKEFEELFTSRYLNMDGEPWRDAPLTAVATWIQARLAQVGEIGRGLQVQNFRDTYAQVGLGSFFDTFTAAPPAARRAALPLFRIGFHSLWVDEVTRDIPALAPFSGETHNKKIERFRDLDRRQLEAVPSRIREATKARSPKMYPEEVKILKGQLARRRTGEVRKLLAQMPNLLFALKPCVMMNPLSVRLFLDAEAISFDVVLFDDASQIATEDAIGAILRGKQVIIAGDPKQLPPLALLRGGEGSAIGAGGFESVLDAASNVAGRGSSHFGRHTLNWHYRSQNESLIAFSRRHFYPDLVSFPAANTEPAIRYVPVTDEPDEETRAARAVDLLVDYARQYPDHTLAVITLTDEDNDRILGEIARRREEDPHLTLPVPHAPGGSVAATGGEDDGSEDDAAETFFVKTIENVQGDERDMVLMYVTDPSHCAPLHQPCGDRLLNVATTRARRHMIVVSAVTPGETPATEQEEVLSADARRAIDLLHAFLHFAQKEAAEEVALAAAAATVVLTDSEAENSAGEENGIAAPGAFERIVERALAERGLLLRRQVGLSDFRVDLAVVDPKQPERYLLGVECDGATYAASATARHRDRLRYEMLTQRGWNLHRVWSLDWNRDAAAQVRRIEAALARVQPLK